MDETPNLENTIVLYNDKDKPITLQNINKVLLFNYNPVSDTVTIFDPLTNTNIPISKIQFVSTVSDKTIVNFELQIVWLWFKSFVLDLIF